MSKNIGFSKKMAKDVANTLNCQDAWTAYPQKEEHWPAYPPAKPTHQWVVVVQKKQDERSSN